MCGIVGYTGPRKASTVIIDGLKRLEYRGYDSAGIALGSASRPGSKLEVTKRTGKVSALMRAVSSTASEEPWGIGHTRWATHGGVTEANAHPHLDSSGRIAVVHNGIIENHRALHEMLVKDGVRFMSETDTEVIPHLIARYYHGDLEVAVRKALVHLEGTYGIACICADEPGRIVGARNGSPLVLGIGQNEMFLASDVAAMIAFTNQVVYLNDGEIVSLDATSWRISDRNDRELDKNVDEVTWELGAIEKGDFACYMEKEIFEQTESVARAIGGRLDFDHATSKLGGLNLDRHQLRAVGRVRIIAAGTSWHAGLVGAWLFETLARLPSSSELASEIRYRNPVIEKDSLWFIVSQSGETADTLFAMREIQRKGAIALGICNVVGSTIARESDGGIYVHSGPEIAVASTKAFTSQLSAFYLVALLFARMRDLSREDGQKFLTALAETPAAIKKVLGQRDRVQTVAKKYSHAKSFLFLGRGIMYPIALEGALKLKEISYIHAEGCGAGEMKHGPIALITPEVPSLFLVPDDHLREKIISNIREIKARGGPVIAVGVEGDHEVESLVDDFIAVPKGDPRFYPFTMIVPLQLLAYFCALELGRDIDQPRNLAKSVTVE